MHPYSRSGFLAFALAASLLGDAISALKDPAGPEAVVLWNEMGRLHQLAFTDSHAAAIKHTVIRVEKTRGVVKAYLQLKAVTATKQIASAHAMLRTPAKVSAESPPSSHANIAANKRNTEKKNPNALKKSQ